MFNLGFAFYARALYNDRRSNLSNSKEGISIPLNASPWVIIRNLFGENWQAIKYFTMSFFVAIITYGFIKKRINATLISASFLFFFVNIFLIDGSMNRLNIGLLIVILLLDYDNQMRVTLALSVIYLLYGFITFACMQYIDLYTIYDSAFNLLFTIIFIAFLFRKAFGIQIAFSEK